MRKGLNTLVIALALAASGCGSAGGEDFVVDVQRPPTAVYSAVGGIDPNLASRAFPGLKVVRSRPSEDTLLVEIPDSGLGASQFTFRVSDGEGGGSRIHVSITVPAVKVTFEGKTQYISELRVQTAARRILRNAVQDLEAGSSGGRAATELSMLVAAVAVATNPKYLKQLESGTLELSLLDAALRSSLGEDGERGPSLDDNGDEPMDNPDRAQWRAETEQYRANAGQERQQEAAAAPMDYATGDSASGDNPNPSDDY
jgi:hypothetical protein